MRRPDPAPLQLDGDLDSDIVFHEYGHGLTWRMIGGMSGPLAGAIGEGMSDVLAFLINGDDRVGEYSAQRSAGHPPRARTPTTRAPTATSPARGVHFDGEVYAASAGSSLQNFQAGGLTEDDLLRRPGRRHALHAGDADLRADARRHPPVGGRPRATLAPVWNGVRPVRRRRRRDLLVAGGVVTVTESFANPGRRLPVIDSERS